MSSDRVFENPANGHRETVSGTAWLWSLLFGWFYMLTVGLWGHVFIQIFVFGLIAFIGGGPLLVFAAPVVWLIYAASIGSMLANRYLRQGWREVRGNEPREPANSPTPSGLTHLYPAAPVAPPLPAAAPTTPTASVADELSKLAALRDSGVLTAMEFSEQKAALLAASKR